ncbi:MAG: hypothetical protein AAF501_18410, partial [Pseudomonadota bacterium]
PVIDALTCTFKLALHCSNAQVSNRYQSHLSQPCVDANCVWRGTAMCVLGWMAEPDEILTPGLAE